MNHKIKIMLVEDNAAYRRGINCALDAHPDMELISEFAIAEIALRSLQDMRTRNVPDLILLDLNLPGMNGLEALEEFKRVIPDTKILILTQSNKEADVLNGIQKGASGYLLKSSSMDDLIQGIQTVHAGGATIDSDLAGFILHTLRLKLPNTNEKIKLSPREMDTLSHLAEGLSQKEIAIEMEISAYTVNEHIRHIYEKMNVPNAPAAINKAHRMGLFSKHTF